MRMSKKTVVKKNNGNYEMEAEIKLKLDFLKDKKDIVAQAVKETKELAKEMYIDPKEIWCQFEGDGYGLILICKGPVGVLCRLREQKTNIFEDFPEHKCIW